MAGVALLRSVFGFDASRISSMSARFSSPVYPGETLRTEVWQDDNAIMFRCRVVERDRVVLDRGRATLAPPAGALS